MLMCKKICDSCYGCFEQSKGGSTNVFKWDSLVYRHPHGSLMALWANAIAIVKFVI